MTRFEILLFNLEPTLKKLDRLCKKSSNISYRLGDTIVVNLENNSHHKVMGRELFVEGSYKVNGWEFVAHIKHFAHKNIITQVNYDIEIPTKYRTSPPICEHCNKNIYRKDTYLVYNTTSKEFKQLGKACIEKYTSGLSAEECVLLAQTYETINNSIQDMNMELCNLRGSYFNGLYSSDKVKIIAVECVKTGQDKKYLRDIYNKYNFENVSHEYSEIIKKIDEWIKTENDTSLFFSNASVAWSLDYISYSEFGLIIGLIKKYINTKQREASTNNTYAGNIGDKIIIKVASARVLYTKVLGRFGVSYIYEIVDDLGRVYIWSTSLKSSLKSGCKLSATIKTLGEYKNIKQTVITRGKVSFDSEDSIL